jgi:cyclophilin family peptidyl-prolyl cis-trans isomerase
MPRAAALIASLAAACLFAAGCGEEDEPAPAAAPKAEQGCESVQAPAPKEDGDLPKPKLELDRDKRYVATVDTSCGTFEITLDARRAPKTGGSFLSLARAKFFDDGVFHRIVPNFVIQGGDPTHTGMGGPGYSVTEKPPADLTYDPGVVAMAKTGAEAPGTSGSQFYVVTGSDAAQLPPEYALLGKVTRGMDVVDRIGAVPVEGEGAPVDPVVIRSIRVQES